MEFSVGVDYDDAGEEVLAFVVIIFLVVQEPLSDFGCTSAGVLSIVGHVFAHYVCHRTSHPDCKSLRPFILVREPLVDFGSLVGVATSACTYTPPCMYVYQRASQE